MPLFLVQRHGGHANHCWRVIRATADSEEAVSAFERAKATMRQGGLRLTSDGGTVLRLYTAPLLKRVW